MRLRRLAGILAVLLLLVVVVGAFFVLRDRFGTRTPGLGTPEVATSPAAPFEIWFTSPVYPDKPENHHGGIDEHFVQFVDGATKTLDIAVYDFDLENVAQAMARAKARGVAVRMVTDSDTLNNTKDAEIQKAFGIVKGAGISVVPDERQAIMHDKFAVRDGAEVWTGSWNFTSGDTYRLNNNAARLHSPELARAYTSEFEYMFSQHKFGGSRPKGQPIGPVQVGSAQIQLLFAPDNGVAQRLAERISQSTSSIRFAAFSFTQDAIGKAVLDRAKAGVSVSGVFEKTGSETRFSEYGPMKQAGLDVYQDGNPYLMHHKVFVLDNRITVFGSFNFSDSADKDNDENCLIVDDPAVAKQFSAEIDRMLAAAKQPSPVKATPARQEPR
jgi:phosphatidylserine/phosphatidylglycerophosphate/cardiolipin synthase-like enzyme